MHTDAETHTHKETWTHIRPCIHTHTHTHTQIGIPHTSTQCTYAKTKMHWHAYTHTCWYIQTHPHTHIQTHTKETDVKHMFALAYIHIYISKQEVCILRLTEKGITFSQLLHKAYICVFIAMLSANMLIQTRSKVDYRSIEQQTTL